MGVNRFYVISIKDVNGINKVHNSIDQWYGSEMPASVIIYPERYDGSSISGLLPNYKPYHRAFLDGAIAKITPTADNIFRTAYPNHVGVNGAQAVPSLDESAWLDGTQTFTPYDSFTNKWTKEAFDSAGIVASAAPVQSNIRLAGGFRPLLEAVLADKLRVKGRGDLA